MIRMIKAKNIYGRCIDWFTMAGVQYIRVDPWLLGVALTGSVVMFTSFPGASESRFSDIRVPSSLASRVASVADRGAPGLIRIGSTTFTYEVAPPITLLFADALLALVTLGRRVKIGQSYGRAQQQFDRVQSPWVQLNSSLRKSFVGRQRFPFARLC